MSERFTITFKSGAYYVSIPNYKGGEVVPAEAYDRLAAAQQSAAATCETLMRIARSNRADPAIDDLTVPLAVELAEAQATISRLTAERDAAKGALEGVSAFVGIMFGKGPAAAIPETVTCPLGFEIKLGEIMRKAETALATTSDTDADGRGER